MTKEHAKMTREFSFHSCLENCALLQNILQHAKESVKAAGLQEHARAFHHNDAVQVRHSIEEVGSMHINNVS